MIISTFYECNPIIKRKYELFFNFLQYRDINNYNHFSENYDFHYRKILMNYFLEATKKISEKFTDYNIIYRPHPAENKETYKKIFYNFKNIIVSNSGSVNEWISSAEVVIHHDCTSGVQTFFNNKIPLSYCPIYDKNIAQTVAVDVSKKIVSLEDLIKYINKVTKNKKISKINNKDKSIIKPILANIEYSSGDKISKIIENLVKDHKFINKNYNTLIRDSKKRNIYFKFLNIAFKILFRKLIKNRENIKFPKFNYVQVNNYIKTFNKYSINIQNLKISKIGEYCLKIYR